MTFFNWPIFDDSGWNRRVVDTGSDRRQIELVSVAHMGEVRAGLAKVERICTEERTSSGGFKNIYVRASGFLPAKERKQLARDPIHLAFGDPTETKAMWRGKLAVSQRSAQHFAPSFRPET